MSLRGTTNERQNFEPETPTKKLLKNTWTKLSIEEIFGSFFSDFETTTDAVPWTFTPEINFSPTLRVYIEPGTRSGRYQPELPICRSFV